MNWDLAFSLERSVLASVRGKIAVTHSNPQIPLNPIADCFRVSSVQFRPLLTEAAFLAGNSGHEIYIRAEPEKSSFLQSTYLLDDRFLPRRIRFSLAHELAHAAIYNLEKSEGSGMLSGLELEMTCNRLAAAILVPRKILKQFGPPKSAQHLLDLAKLFNVSIEVITRRLFTVWPSLKYSIAVCYVDLQSSRNSAHMWMLPKHFLGEDIYSAFVRKMERTSDSSDDLMWIRGGLCDTAARFTAVLHGRGAVGLLRILETVQPRLPLE